MAVLGRLLISSAERLDLPDFLSIDSYVQGDFKYLMKSFVGSDRPYVLTGFDIINPGAAIGTQNVTVRVANSVVYYPQSLAGPYFHGLEEGNTLSAPLVPELRKDSTNYIYLTLTTTDAAKDTRAFWDPDKEGGDGGEFTQDVNTQSALVSTINVSTSSFPEGTVPVAIVVMDVNSIVSIQDARDMMFRLGTGGLSPDPLSTYAFRDEPDSASARLETNTLMSSSLDANAFEGGDKNIESLKEWMDVVMTRLKELGGTTYWYEDTSTFNLVNMFKDALATSTKSKGLWTSSDGTPGLLTWTEDIFVQSVSDSKDVIVRNGNNVLANDQTMYIPLVRGAEINTGSVDVTWTNAAIYVNGVLGSFENLTKGDWIKKSDDPDYRYLRVEEFYLATDGAGGVATAATALSVTLSAAYGGTSEDRRGVYTQGEYLGGDVLVADRNDAALTDLGGDLFWMAMRSDTIMDVSDITTTDLSIDIEDHDGVTAKCTSVAHGLTDAQRVGISGTTNFDGTYAVEVEDVDTFFINITGGPFGNELTQAAHYATVTTQARQTADGFDLESENHEFDLDQTIQVTDTTNYDATYKVFPTGNTTFTIPVSTAIANEAAGTATAVIMYVRTDLGPTRLSQGENKQIGEVETENLMSFIGMDNSSQTYPAYHTAPDYNTLDAQQNFNSDITDNLTQRTSKLTAMMADKAQDKTIKYLADDLSSVHNTTNGAAQELTFVLSTATLTLLQPGSPGNAVVTLPDVAPGISLLVNQSAYVTIDRNLATAPSITVVDTDSLVVAENMFVIASRLSDIDCWIWDSTHIALGATPIGPNGDLIKVQMHDPISTTLPTGAVTTDGIAVDPDDLVLYSNLTVNDNRIYKAIGSIGNITGWTAQSAFDGFIDPAETDTVVVIEGDAFAGTIGIFTAAEWSFNNVVRHFSGADYWEVSSLNSNILTDNQAATATAEITEITADSRTNTSDGQYFDIDAQAGTLYRVYMDTTGGSATIPAAGGRTLTEVDISAAADTAAGSGDAVAAVLNGLADFACPATGTGIILCTDANTGTVPDAVNGDLGNAWNISVDTQGAAAGILFSIDYENSENMIIDYSIKRGSLKETGTMAITTDGVDVGIAATAVDVAAPVGVTYSAEIDGTKINLLYSTTSTGTNAEMKWSLKRWSDSPGGPAGIPSYSSSGGSGSSFKVEYITLSAGQITAKSITLAETPATASETALDIVTGNSQDYGTDFTVAGSVLSWNGLVLDGVLIAGDQLRVMYSF